MALQPFIRTADLELLTNLDCYEVLTWNVAMLQKVHENATVFCCYRMLYQKKNTKYLGSTFTQTYLEGLRIWMNLDADSA